MDLAIRYLPDFRLPDKAIDLVDQACAMAMMRSFSAKGRAGAVQANVIGKGYIGHDEGGRLTDAVRAKPYSVVLFDEVEKAHPRVLDLFLQVFDEGTLTDSRGRKASFRETVIILTSNLGSAAPVRKKMGFGGGADDADNLQARVAEAVRRHLRPELLNRISRTVVFNPLTREHVRAVAEKFIARLNARLAEQGVWLTLDESVYALLMERGYPPELGARPMKRAIDSLIAQPLARVILEGGLRGKIRVRASEGAVVFAVG